MSRTPSAITATPGAGIRFRRLGEGPSRLSIKPVRLALLIRPAWMSRLRSRAVARLMASRFCSCSEASWAKSSQATRIRAERYIGVG